MIAQVAIALFGVAAIWLTQDARADRRRFACIVGLIAQPFWFHATIAAQQWGMVAVCVLYTLAWARGFWTQWVRA